MRTFSLGVVICAPHHLEGQPVAVSARYERMLAHENNGTIHLQSVDDQESDANYRAYGSKDELPNMFGLHVVRGSNLQERAWFSSANLPTTRQADRYLVVKESDFKRMQVQL